MRPRAHRPAGPRNRLALVKGHGFSRDTNRRPELLSLDEGPLCEFGTGNTSGKAEIRLDPRRRPGLTTGGHCLQHDGGQSLRRPVEAAASPAGPAPTMTKSHRVVGTSVDCRPITLASSTLLGFRGRAFPPNDDGVSSGPTPISRRIASAPGSSSTSIHRWGRRLRIANSRNRWTSDENRDPADPRVRPRGRQVWSAGSGMHGGLGRPVRDLARRFCAGTRPEPPTPHPAPERLQL